MSVPGKPAALDLELWADLSKSGEIAKRFSGDPDGALSAARVALGYRNVVVQRNAVRLIEAAFRKMVPLEDGHPALTALEGSCVEGRPLVMWEAMAAGRRLQKENEHDLNAPYPGVVDGRRSDAAIWAWVWGGPGSLSYLRMRTRMDLRPEEYRALIAGADRPEREFLEALEAKRRKPKRGDLEYAADLSKPVFTKEELATSLGKRVFHFHNLSPCKWEIFEARNFVVMSSRDRTPSEDSLIWQVEFGQSLWKYPGGRKGPLAYSDPVMGLSRLSGPRGKVVEDLRADLQNSERVDSATALLFVRLVEDPVLLPDVQALLASPNKAVRLRALATAAVVGDDGTLDRARDALKTSPGQAADHVWALGFLGDRRAYDLVWKIAETAKAPDQALLAAAMFDELSDGWEGRIAAAPKWATNVGVLYGLCARWTGRELDGLLRIVDLAATVGLDEKVLKRFALSKSQLSSFRGFVAQMYWTELGFAGFKRDSDGTFHRKPGLAPLTPAEEEALKGQGWWKHMGECNRYFGSAHSALTYGSTIQDWAGALMRHFAAAAGDSSQKLDDRALALRRLALVAGEDAPGRIDRALANMPKADSAALRALAFPPKKRGGKNK